MIRTVWRNNVGVRAGFILDSQHKDRPRLRCEQSFAAKFSQLGEACLIRATRGLNKEFDVAKAAAAFLCES